MGRILLRVLVGLTAAILLGALVIQFILFTNIPRNLVLRSLENKLHLRADTESLSTGWLGHTTLHNVSFLLPLAEHPILIVDTLDVQHTSLIPLLFGRDLTIHRLDFHQPAFQIVKGGDERWNVQDVAALLGSGSDKSAGSSASLIFPEINLIDGNMEVIDGNRHQTIDGLQFASEPEGTLSWKFDLSIADRIQVRGRLIPGGAWTHEATVQFSDIAEWARPWFKLPPGSSGKATWRGRVSPNGVQGRLDASEIKTAGFSAAGGIDITLNSDGLDLRPDRLQFTTPSAAINQFTARNGDIRYLNKLIRAQSVQLDLCGGQANLTGYYDLAALGGELTAGWDNLALPGQIFHGGNLALSVHRPFPTQLIVEGTLLSHAKTPQGPWQGKLNFGADGNPDAQINWHFDTPELAWNRRTPIRLDGLAALGVINRLTGGPATVVVNSVRLPDTKAMNGTGLYSDADESWVLKLSGNHWPLQPLQNAVIGFDIDARGNAHGITLNHFTLTQANTTLSASGSYRFGIPKPVDVMVTLTSPPSETAAERSIVEGALRGDMQVAGTLLPLNLSLDGHLSGRSVRVADRDIGDVALRVSGEVNPEHAQLVTGRLTALGGDWSLRATENFAEEELDTDLRVSGLPLKNIGRATDTTVVHGTVAGEWDAYLVRFPLTLQNIRMRGETWISNLEYRGLCVDQVHFNSSLDDGTLRLDPITLNLAASGQGNGALEWAIDHPRHLQGTLSLSHWQFERGKDAATINLDVPSFSIDLPDPAGANGAGIPLEAYADTISADLSLQYDKQRAGNLSLAAELNGRRASISDLHGLLLDAPINGTAQLDLAHPLESTGSLSFEKLEASRLSGLFPPAHGLTGMIRGSASFSPATLQHPLEPVALHLQANFDHGSFRSLPIGVLNLNAFMNTHRVVLDDRPGHDSTLDIAGGTVRMWGRVGSPSPGIVSSQAVLQFSDLDLNEIAHSAKPDIKPTPGRVSGNVMLLYNSRADLPSPATSFSTTESGVSPLVRQFVEGVYGEGRLELTNSDIATLPIFSDLYNLFSLGFAGSGPIGHGSLELRLENGTLYIPNIDYFNRGTELLAQVTSPEMWDFPGNDIDGSILCSPRPLSGLKLPLVSDLDSALDTLQGNLNCYLISGTWKKPRLTQIGLANLGQEMKDLLAGNINNPSSSTSPPP